MRPAPRGGTVPTRRRARAIETTPVRAFLFDFVLCFACLFSLCMDEQRTPVNVSFLQPFLCECLADGFMRS